MVQTSILDDARKLLAATKAGKIQPGQQLSLAEFARLAGLTWKAAKRLLEVWGTFRETGLAIEGTEITTKGGIPRYAVRVQGASDQDPSLRGAREGEHAE